MPRGQERVAQSDPWARNSQFTIHNLLFHCFSIPTVHCSGSLKAES